MTSKLCLLWHDQNSRNWYHVGNLVYENKKYFFYYATKKGNRNVYAAMKKGYRLHPTFPDISHKYESSILFSAFSRRLPNKNRKDYHPMLTSLGITNSTSDFEMLAITGGVLASDNYEFLKPIEHEGSTIKLDFYLRGWRHYTSHTEKLTSEDELCLVQESDNPYDQHAVKIYKNNKEVIGYVPAFYSSFITEMIDRKMDYTLEYSFNEEAVSNYKVRINIVVKFKQKNLLKTIKNFVYSNEK